MEKIKITVSGAPASGKSSIISVIRDALWNQDIKVTYADVHTAHDQRGRFCRSDYLINKAYVEIEEKNISKPRKPVTNAVIQSGSVVGYSDWLQDFREQSYRDLFDVIIRPNKVRAKFFYTFQFKDRDVTLCLITREDTINVGYSVRCPGDTYNQQLGKDIAQGRAEKKPLEVIHFNHECSADKGVLKGIARFWERKIRKDPSKYIKGIK